MAPIITVPVKATRYPDDCRSFRRASRRYGNCGPINARFVASASGLKGSEPSPFWSGCDQTVAHGDNCQFGRIRGLQLLLDIIKMGPDGARAKRQHFGDFIHRLAARQRQDDLELLVAQYFYGVS